MASTPVTQGVLLIYLIEPNEQKCSTIYHTQKYTEVFIKPIGLVGRVFANGPGDLGLIPGRVIPKTLKMVLDTSLLSTQQYKVRIKGKVEQFRERSSTFRYTSV